MWFILGILLTLLVLAGAFFYFSMAKPVYRTGELTIVQKPNITENTVIGENHINYLLSQAGAYNLHNNPIGGKPVISLVVDEDKFYSEIDKGVITTQRGEITGEDIKIVTTREEVINTFKAENGNDYLKNSVASGKTSIEMTAGYTTLLSKGYLNLYKEMTGKSLTGSAVKIFGG